MSLSSLRAQEANRRERISARNGRFDRNENYSFTPSYIELSGRRNSRDGNWSVSVTISGCHWFVRRKIVTSTLSLRHQHVLVQCLDSSVAEKLFSSVGPLGFCGKHLNQ